jgi:hypothetical protein
MSVQKVVETVCQAPAKGLSRWSARTLAEHLDIPSATVNRILRENKLQPHRLRSFIFSPDPQFGEKLLEVVALYMNPPDNAVVQWLKAHPLVSFHHTPTHASWVKLIECFFM